MEQYIMLALNLALSIGVYSLLLRNFKMKRIISILQDIEAYESALYEQRMKVQELINKVQNLDHRRTSDAEKNQLYDMLDHAKARQDSIKTYRDKLRDDVNYRLSNI